MASRRLSSPTPPTRSIRRGELSALLTEQVGPVARHSIARTGNRLVLRMAFRRGKFRTFVVVIGLVVPEPVLARFERSDDRVFSLSPVCRRVPRQRIVAATDVAAGRTPPQVHPPTTGGITLGTADTTGRHRGVDSSRHATVPSSLMA